MNRFGIHLADTRGDPRSDASGQPPENALCDGLAEHAHKSLVDSVPTFEGGDWSQPASGPLQSSSRDPGCMNPPPLSSGAAVAQPQSSRLPSESPYELRLRGLIAGICANDEQDLVRLYDATVARVFRLALLMTHDRQTAEEIAEDVYWQVWRNARRFDPQRCSVTAWLLTIARNRAIDNLRHKDEALVHPDPEMLGESESSHDCPANSLEGEQRSGALHAALTTLEPLQRQLLALAFFRGLSHEGIAAQTALPLGTVKSHIRRGLAILRRKLAIKLGDVASSRRENPLG